MGLWLEQIISGDGNKSREEDFAEVRGQTLWNVSHLEERNDRRTDRNGNSPSDLRDLIQRE